MSKILSIKEMLTNSFSTCSTKIRWILSYGDIDTFIVKIRERNSTANTITVSLYVPLENVEAIAGQISIMNSVRKWSEQKEHTIHLRLTALDCIGNTVGIENYEHARIIGCNFTFDIEAEKANPLLDTTQIDLTFFCGEK